MRIRKTVNFSQLFLYLTIALGMFFLQSIGKNGEPFPLPLTYAAITAGLSPISCVFLYILSSFIHLNAKFFVLHFGQGILLILGFLLQNRLRKSNFLKSSFFPLFSVALALSLYVTISDFQVYFLPFYSFLNDPLTQKFLVCALCFLLSAIFSVALKALLRKFLRCRIRGDELLFISLFFVFIGVGACRFLGLNAYMGIAFLFLLLFSYITKDCTALIVSFLLSLPPFLIAGISIERFFIYGISAVLFSKYGRVSLSIIFLCIFFLYAYFDGLFLSSSRLLTPALLSALLPTLLFILIPAPFLRSMENKLVFYREKHLSRIAINRNRAAIGEQLFEISAVFREIQSTFSSLGTGEAKESAKQYICACIEEETCRDCPNFTLCKEKDGREGLRKLVDVGCLKGKVNLIDVPKALTEVCARQSDLLYAVNRQLAEYKKYMLEAENAASSRAMLAKQAQGISEILKNLALEQSEPLKIYTEKERALNVALLGAGIVCSETLVFGDEQNLTLSLITFGKADVKKIAVIASQILNAPMIISERLTLSQDKFCCILKKKPRFDAAFGVATRTKQGEQASGDAHSVIKIDERKFMVALSDGMGSGEYAKQVSESTISLLESFYRAKMPSELILSAINKLLTFGKEESFACVDIAVVDLDSGFADIVKIGSPIGFILSGNTVKVLETTSLPLGILDSLRPDTSSYELLENDILLFLSDGIADAFGSTTDLYEALRRLPLKNPQELADILMGQALQGYGGQAKDDMTVVAVRLFINKTEI